MRELQGSIVNYKKWGWYNVDFYDSVLFPIFFYLKLTNKCAKKKKKSENFKYSFGILCHNISNACLLLLNTYHNKVQC